MWLDDRWDVGWWDSDDAAAAPGGVCAACQRRAAWLVIGGRDYLEDLEPDGSFMESNPVYLCAWCQPPYGEIENSKQLAEALAEARARGISWRRWRWHPRDI
jgi:hypothetical protein